MTVDAGISSTHLVGKSSPDGTLCSALLVHELHEVGLAAASLVVFSFVRASGEEFDRWVPRYLVPPRDILVLLIVGVNVGNYALEGVREQWITPRPVQANLRWTLA